MEYSNQLEHIFDIYTKEYPFQGSDIQVLSAQDQFKFYRCVHVSNFNIHNIWKWKVGPTAILESNVEMRVVFVVTIVR
jgi:hypothetical protein